MIWPALLQAQHPVQRVEPPHWYVQMPEAAVQLLLYGDGLSAWEVDLTHPGVTITATDRVSNPNYLFVTLHIDSAAAPVTLELTLTNGNRQVSLPYRLEARQSDNRAAGISQEDVLYLIYPDRFVNGDTTNDVQIGMLDSTCNRSSLTDRHGGDLQGILQSLDYLQQLGVTALWLNPVFTNDQPRTSYHGYNATDLYAVDPRLGSNDLYRQLADSLHQRGMKLVMDLVHNHVGNQTWWVQDPPEEAWFHQWPTFTKSSFRSTTLTDPYASDDDKRHFVEGWFDQSMVDLNQDHPLLSTYLIQQSLWWTEFAGIDAYRLDTYPFSDPDFLKAWGASMAEAFPEVSLFGETFVSGIAEQDYFHGRTHIDKDFQSHLTGVTDFSLYFALLDALQEEQGWETGMSKVYKVLAADYLLADATGNVIFLDNHDVSRFFTVIGEDMDSWRMGVLMLLTLRGIPCLYYGTEILMANKAEPDGLVRLDFPGGWPGDAVDKFQPAGRTALEQEAFDWLQRLLQWRRQHPQLAAGRLMQFVPQDDCYVYFRYTDDECAMIVVNTSSDYRTLDTQRFTERLAGMNEALEVMTDEKMTIPASMQVPPRTAQLWHLQQ